MILVWVWFRAEIKLREARRLPRRLRVVEAPWLVIA